MSGPFQPSDYRGQPAQGGWPGNQGYGRPGPGGPGGQGGPYGPPNYGGQNGGAPWDGGAPQNNLGEPWGEPPRPKRSVGRTITAIVSIVVIIGGIATAIVLLHNRGRQSAGPPPASSANHPGNPSGTNGSTRSTILGTAPTSIHVGQCATGSVDADGHYIAGQQVTCGAPNSALALPKVVDSVSQCEALQYVPLQAGDKVDCFTLDLKQGDCTDSNFLKVPCGSGAFSVLAIESGPGTSSSCRGVNGASRWIPVGFNPPHVACIAPTKTSS